MRGHTTGCRICQTIGDASWIFILGGAVMALLIEDSELGKFAAYLVVAGLALQLGAIASALLRRALSH